MAHGGPTMSWRYEQSTGKLWRLVGQGYSGLEEAKNQPGLESVKDRGPIPRGQWKIGAPVDRDHSPYCLPLAPANGVAPWGRTGFLMHGDSIQEPGTASHGCIIMPRDVRTAVWTSGDHDLEVV